MVYTLEAQYKIPETLNAENFALYGDGLLVNDCLNRYNLDRSVVRHVKTTNIAVVITSLNINSIRKAFGICETNIYRIDAMDYINDHNLTLAALPTATQNNTLCNNA